MLLALLQGDERTKNFLINKVWHILNCILFEKSALFISLLIIIMNYFLKKLK
jgi:hypothetical protein